MTALFTCRADTAERMREIGSAIGSRARQGDLIVLSGDLGAGKTTITQGIARGMGILDAVTSPTFVIARSHPHPAGGPDLVHVDAYRLSSVNDILDLDLESDTDYSVTVVEWGEEVPDDLTASRLVVRIQRSDDESDESRVVILEPRSGHWLDEDLARLGDSQ